MVRNTSSTIRPKSALRKYLVSLGAVLAAIILRLAVGPFVDSGAGFFFFIPPVLVAAWYGGLGPGMFATMFSSVAAWWLLTLNIGFEPFPEFKHWFTGSSFFFVCGALTFATVIARRTAEAASRNEKRAQELLETANEGVWLLDSNGCTEYVNGRLAEMLNFTPDEMLGRHFLDFVDPRAREEAAKGWQRRQLGGMEQYDLKFQRKDGADLYAIVSTTSRHDAKKNFVGALAMVIDVTDKQQARVALQVNEERLRMAVEASQLGLWDSDLAAGKIWWSEKLFELLRMNPRTDKPLPYGEFLKRVHPEDIHLFTSPRPKAVSGTPFSVEFRILRGDGTYGWLLSHAESICNDKGQMIRTVGVCLDITARKEAEKERETLLSSEQVARLEAESAQRRFRQLVEGIDAIVLEFDWSTSKFTFVSPQVVSVLGYPLEEWLANGGKMWKRIVHPEDAQRTHEFCTAESESGRNHRLEYRVTTADGRVLWMQEIAYPQHDSDGRLLIRALLVDITERKRFERELQQAKEIAEAADRAKDQFLAILSHELRTPLTPVLAAVSSRLSLHDMSSETRAMLEMIKQNVTLEARLIDDLLDLTRVRKGKLQLHRRTVDAHASLNAALDICRDDISDKRLGIELELSAEKHNVHADPARLQQVFWNLIKNAVKFTPPEGKIAFRSRNDEDGRLHVEVTDNGIGMEPAVLSRIFNAFEQGHAAINRRYGGLGLGLVISRSVVEMHGGVLSAASPGVDQGSTFTVMLPTVTAAVEVDPPLPIPQSATPSEALRILVVEDNRDTLGVIGRLLKHSGHRVQLAESVHTAKRVLDAFEMDLLVSDIGLPDGSGLDLMEYAREKRPNCRGIALSGFGTDADMEKSRTAGFATHLTKPVLYETLESDIAMVMDEAPTT